MRAAINAHCRDCLYDSAERGTWRQQVEACSITGCALWPFRPRAARPRQERDGEEAA